jgi:hypothetical protein
MIGGGPSAGSSQLSIEQNMLFFRRALVAVGRNDLRPEVLFASGPDALPDVCAQSVDKLSRVQRLLAEILGHRHAVELQYRPHDIGPVDGPARREAIVASLDRQARELAPSDRLIIYVSGHGGKGDPTSNGRLSTWDGEDISVRDFTEALDRIDPSVQVIVVMVQCYSGAFANILFEKGDPNRPIAPHQRAGFFATVDSRPAAGCTADTKVENYREYSTSFLSALAGRDRLGEPIEADDIDQDGVISLAEAHAHAVETAPTIDICFRTSDRYLQTQARLDPSNPQGVVENSPLADLLQWADPVRRHSLTHLVQELSLPTDRPVDEAQKQSKRLTRDRRKAQNTLYKSQDEADRRARKIEDALMVRWPFLESGWHPQTQALLSERSDEVIRRIEEHEAFADWEKARQRCDELREQDLRQEREWAKYQRVLLLAKSIARAENLRRDGDAAKIARYEQLLRLEGSTIHLYAATPSTGRAN